MTIQQERSLLDKLLHPPRLPIYVQEIQAVLADEAQKRQRFYDQISEQDKAEFINGEIIFHSPMKLRHNLASGHLYRYQTYLLWPIDYVFESALTLKRPFPPPPRAT